MINNDIIICASNFYKNELIKYPNSQEAQYLEKRKLSQKTISEFGIGISTLKNFNGIIEHIQKNNFNVEEAIDYGILIRSEFNPKYINDNMRGRVVVEIKDYKGNIIGFGGRDTLNNECKYLNTPTTPLFTKKNNLFNLDKAKYFIQYLNKFNYIILVEGYFDVMSLWDKGIKNVVAPMGTALTDEQCKLIRMFTDNVVLCFDGDEAGQNALKKSINLLNKNNLNPIPMILPNGMDADDVIQKLGVNEFINILDKSIFEFQNKEINRGTYRK